MNSNPSIRHGCFGFTMAWLIVFSASAMAEDVPAGWQFVDISGTFIGLRPGEIQAEYKFLESYSYGLDSSAEKFDGKASAYIVSDLIWLRRLLKKAKSGEEFAENFNLWQRQNSIPETMESVLVQTLDITRLRNKIVHISFFVKTRPYRFDDVFRKADMRANSKLSDEELESIRKYLDGKFRGEKFVVNMQAWVHKADKILRYETTSEPETVERDWQRFTSMVSIPEDATALTIGFGISGFGKAWADEFVVIQKGDANPEFASRFAEYNKATPSSRKSALERRSSLLADSMMKQTDFMLPELNNENFESAVDQFIPGLK